MKTIQEKAEERLQKEREERAVELAVELKTKIAKEEQEIEQARKKLKEAVKINKEVIGEYEELLEKLEEGELEEVEQGLKSSYGRWFAYSVDTIHGRNCRSVIVDDLVG
jgi:F0F1-type ATP synthase membrane subunit b/b'